jgi:murein DD-endopeptidase MepM/ murein hydrolase activator NlpD
MDLRVFLRVAACVCLAGLGGCLGAQAPAPVTYYGRTEGAGSTGVHTVSSGETLYKVAGRYRLPIRDIVALNDIRPPFALTAGQRLRLPPPREYRVRNGDSLYEVSRLFATDTREIVRLNVLSAPYRLEPGQTLRLPSPTEETRSAPPTRVHPVAPPPHYSTSVGDRIRERWRSLLALGNGNRTTQPNPDAFDSAGIAPLAPPPEKPPARSAEAILGLSLEDLFSGRKPLHPASASTARVQGTQTASASRPSSATLSDPPPRAGGAFGWPVRGRLLSAYGPKKGGLHNDGINIAAVHGTPVKAAENGVVVYAGNGLEGYGNLVLIRHRDRWVTAYGHMDKVHVRKGDVLRRGQTIGTTGSTGSVDSPQLHFEIRRGTKAINPKPLLG